MNEMPPQVTLFSEQFSIQCDIVDLVLEPHRYLAANLAAQMDPFKRLTTLPHFGILSNDQELSVLSMELQCIATIDAVCESLVFGSAFLLSPTSSLQLDLDEHSEHHQQYIALLQSLQGRSLLLRMERNSLKMHFVAIPNARTGFFFLKQVAPRELVAPRPNLDHFLESVVEVAFLKNTQQQLEKVT